jgi:hypothetical protein
LIAIPPNRVFRIHYSGTASFIVNELRRNACANNEIGEVVSIYIRFDLLAPEMKIVLAKLFGDRERELQRGSRIGEKRR